MNTLRLAVAAVLVVSGWVLSDAAQADSGADVLKAKGCLNCHDNDKKKVGPAFKDIAAKNAGKSDALVAKLKEGKGHPKVNASDADLKAAVDHVLATK
jgi:cytochrome c